MTATEFVERYFYRRVLILEDNPSFFGREGIVVGVWEDDYGYGVAVNVKIDEDGKYGRSITPFYVDCLKLIEKSVEPLPLPE